MGKREREWFVVQKYNHLTYEPPVVLTEPIFTKASADRERIKLEGTLAKEEKARGVVLELFAVDPPSPLPRVRSLDSGKREGRKRRR